MPGPISTKQWLSALGKEGLQAFQDSFAKTFDISLCFLDLTGVPLVVWSNLPLECDYMIKNNLERCMRERRNMIRVIRNTGRVHIHNCFMGLTFFCAPILCQNQLVCVAHGGGFASSPQPVSLPVPDERLQSILELLYDIFNLVNAEGAGRSPDTSERADSPRDMYLRNRLSARELEVAKLLIAGQTNKEIAGDLFISEKTVKTHVSHILRKLELRDRRQLVGIGGPPAEGR